MLTVKMVSQHDYWLEDELGNPFPASFLQRDAAEVCAVLLNRENIQRVESKREPIYITLDAVTSNTPRDSIGFAKGKQARATVTLGGYAQPVDKTLTVKAKEEPKPVEKHEKIRVEL